MGSAAPDSDFTDVRCQKSTTRPTFLIFQTAIATQPHDQFEDPMDSPNPSHALKLRIVNSERRAPLRPGCLVAYLHMRAAKKLLTLFCTRSARELWSEHWPDSRHGNCVMIWLHGSLSEIEVAQRPRSISHTGFRSLTAEKCAFIARTRVYAVDRAGSYYSRSEYRMQWIQYLSFNSLSYQELEIWSDSYLKSDYKLQLKSDFLKLSPPWVAREFLFARRNLVLALTPLFLGQFGQTKVLRTPKIMLFPVIPGFLPETENKWGLSRANKTRAPPRGVTTSKNPTLPALTLT
eukprot:sb/3467600/